MNAVLVTVGDELLTGATENTNASWLAREITDRGGRVRRIVAVPDDRDVIAGYVRDFSAEFDAVVVTGGLGGTPDDVTMGAVADAFDRDLAVHPDARAAVEETARAFREENPDLVERYEFDTDLDNVASIPAGARPLPNDEGLCPGCVLENVSVLPGVPAEMRAMFEGIAGEFGGDSIAETVYTSEPEGALPGRLDAAGERFDVSVGSYPTPLEEPARVRITGTDPDEVAAAAAWLRERIEVVEPPGDPDSSNPR